MMVLNGRWSSHSDVLVLMIQKLLKRDFYLGFNVRLVKVLGCNRLRSPTAIDRSFGSLYSLIQIFH